MSSTSTSLGAPPLAPLRQDLGLIGLVGLAHSVSHFSQLLLPPLFPWLKEEFAVSYAQLGFVLTVFFVVSCVVQALSGFWVDRFGPRPVLYVGLACIAAACAGYAASSSYWMLTFFAGVAGIGNGVFHPVDYTLLNNKVSPSRLGHAYSAHGITGTLGWAVAPLLMTGVTLAYSWRTALAVGGLVAVAVLVVLLFNHGRLAYTPVAAVKKAEGGSMDFLKEPAVWMCFAFFFMFAVVLGVVQAFAPGATRELHGVALATMALCLTIYMCASAGGMVLGGFLIKDPMRCERVVAVGFAFAACVAVALALLPMPAWLVPVMFGLMGFASGTAGPSRDLLVKQSTPPGATGRVYGVVYGGLDVGQALTPLIFGLLMDHGQFRGVLLGLALVQAMLIFSAFRVRSVGRRQPVAA
jgi:MFS transporter, FSR family, fosmidomycin resistance protein